MTPLATVLAYASKGWQVFPLQVKAKEPLERSRGFYDACTNPERLRCWFERYPYNIGVRTGTASGIFVLDVDGAEGFASLQNLEHENGRLPETLTSLTSRGQHRWFLLDQPLQSSQSRIGAGLDIKADGGYVAAPFSIHPCGKRYEWANPNALPVAAPHWLLKLARTRPANEAPPLQPQRQYASHSAAYGRVVLEREISDLVAAAPGTRNHALNRVAFRLYQLVAGGELDDGDVATALAQACDTNGLAKDDGWRSVRATIASARRAGLMHPRSRGGAA
jgi:Bifunctional DNA primase/polymerase, N-terminal